MSWGRLKGAWGDVTVVGKYNSHQGSAKCIRKVCQLREKCEGHGGDVKVLGKK